MAHQVALVEEARIGSGVGSVAAVGQHAACMFQPDLRQVGIGREAVLLAEHLHEMELAEPRDRSQLGHRDRLRIVGTHVLDGRFQRPGLPAQPVGLEARFAVAAVQYADGIEQAGLALDRVAAGFKYRVRPQHGAGQRRIVNAVSGEIAGTSPVVRQCERKPLKRVAVDVEGPIVPADVLDGAAFVRFMRVIDEYLARRRDVAAVPGHRLAGVVEGHRDHEFFMHMGRVLQVAEVCFQKADALHILVGPVIGVIIGIMFRHPYSQLRYILAGRRAGTGTAGLQREQQANTLTIHCHLCNTT